MPRYDYECGSCDKTHEVIKPVSQFDQPEICPECHKAMLRIISPVQINTSNCQFQAHFNHGLGKRVHSKRDIKNELQRIKGETGKEIVEVGTDNLKSIKKKRKEYTLD